VIPPTIEAPVPTIVVHHATAAPSLWRMLELVIVVGLASYRAARLLATDTLLDGPRHWFFLRFPPRDHPYYTRAYRLTDGTWQVGDRKRHESWIGTLVSCPWCSSVWFAAGIVGALAWWWSVPQPVLVWAAACSAAGICATLAS